MNEHREYRDELAAYTLGALSLPEKLEVERHVAGCKDCAEYLHWLDPAVALLPASVEQRTPTSGLKRSLMSEVNADLKAEKRDARNHKRAEHGVWGSIWRPVTAGVLTVVLVAGLAVGYFVGGNEPDSVFFEAEPNSRIGAQMEMSLERKGDEGTLHIVKLPDLPAGTDYQAWIGRDGEVESSSTFDVRKGGDVVIEGSLEGADSVYITREPEGGSEQPTETPLISAPLS